MLLISQTMDTSNEMPVRSICQKTLGRKEGRVAAERRVLRKKKEAGAKRTAGECEGIDEMRYE